MLDPRLKTRTKTCSDLAHHVLPMGSGSLQEGKDDATSTQSAEETPHGFD